jgi:hypothetical protein
MIRSAENARICLTPEPKAIGRAARLISIKERRGSAGYNDAADAATGADPGSPA